MPVPFALFAPFVGPAIKPFVDQLKRAGSALRDDLLGAAGDTLGDPFAYRGERVEIAVRTALRCTTLAYTELLLELQPREGPGRSPLPPRPGSYEKTFVFHAARRLARHAALRSLFPALREYHQLEPYRGALRAFRERQLPWLRTAVEQFSVALGGGGAVLRECWSEWVRVRAAGDAPSLGVDRSGASPSAEPAAMLDNEWHTATTVADDLARAGYRHLAWLLALRPPGGGPPLPVTAVRFFFYRAVEEDEQLFRSVVWGTLTQAVAAAESGLASLYDALERQQEGLASLYEALQHQEEGLDELLRRGQGGSGTASRSDGV